MKNTPPCHPPSDSQATRATILIVLLLAACGHGPTQANDPSGLDVMEQRLQAATDDLLRVGALGAVLVMDLPSGGHISLSSGHTDNTRTTPVTPDQSFQIASLTKMFTAAGILLLIKDGNLSLDDRVSDYFSGYVGDREITVEQLLNHTSGIADGIYVFFRTGIYPTHRYTLEDMIVLSRVEGGQQFEPGTQFRYNEVGVGILGRLIEMKSGTSRAEFLRARLLQPLGMQDTWFGSEEAFPRDNMAHGYHRNPGADAVVDAVDAKDLSWAISAGDMISTPDDLMKFAAALLEPDNPAGLTLHDFTASPFVREGQTSAIAYGYGMSRDRYAGLTVWGHGGNIYGYYSIFAIEPKSGTRLILWCSISAEPGEERAPIYRQNMVPLVTTALHLAVDR